MKFKIGDRVLVREMGSVVATIKDVREDPYGAAAPYYKIAYESVAAVATLGVYYPERDLTHYLNGLDRVLQEL